VQDVLFDRTTISNWNGYNGGFNAYVTNLSRLQPTKSSDLILSTSPSYQVGPLGQYYQLLSGPVFNADTGTTADQLGLYHFTTVTNIVGTYEIKETNSLVDISYHYVAGDANGNPADFDGDGFPDYLEDINGNGNAADDPTSWLIYNSPSGLATGSGLQVFTPLK
jgi:hypothetical protein